ncbi:sensor histidine kinase [Gehongia tenuis]|uniref:histidine kinase n=1 Tax=Gehongia tenuis TaxID=2763655 RepID=A0A926D5S2_9FIRM|nr:ATP-binding protein [Gehongia tenuis]MBC8532238.1 HAMP domain-containing protein [Gehongia tenuis]
MIKSVLLRRIVLLVLLTVILSAALTYGIYTVTARNTFADIKSEELMPKAEFLADFALGYMDGQISQALFKQVLGSSGVWDATLDIYDITGQTIAYLHPPENIQTSFLDTYLQQVLQGQVVKKTEGSLFQRTDSMLIVGIPITEESGEIRGAILLTKNLQEVSTAMSGLNVTLVLSMLGVFFLMLIPSYYFSSRIVRPLNRMRDVALTLSDGNFTVRADERQKGEIGQMAQSLNVLSRRLATTIGELTLEKNRLSGIVNGINEGLVAVNRHGEVTHTNPALEWLFGPRQEDLLAWIPDGELWQDFDEVVESAESRSRHLVLQDAIIEVSIGPLWDERGQVAGAVGLFRDVTEAERLEQTRRDYVANVSHELKTPVASIRAMTETLEDGLIKDEEKRQHYYGNMLKETMRLSRLIDDLLELSRLQSGSIALHKDRVDVGEIVADVADRYQGMAKKAGLSFKLEMPSEDLVAYTNGDRVEQILIILLDNAVKYTPEGGIGLGALDEGNCLRLYVKDTGTGISGKDLEHVFDRFYKVDKAHATTGTGLGLSIAKEILKLMDEDIWAESEPGEGACFSFTLHKA